MRTDEYGTIMLEWGRPETLLARAGLSPRPPEPGAVGPRRSPQDFVGSPAVEAVPDLTVEDLTLVGLEDGDESEEVIIIGDDAEPKRDGAPAGEPRRTEARRTGPHGAPLRREPGDGSPETGPEPVDGGGWRGRFFVPVSLGTKPIWEARRLRS